MNAIEQLSDKIERTTTPAELAELYTQRGKLFHGQNSIQDAINDFNSALEIDPELIEAKSYINYIYEILDYRYMQYFNV